MATKLQERFSAACKDIARDIHRGFESGRNLVGVIELSDGRTSQLQLTMTTDELDFLDVDEPTGCADDLTFSEASL